ncbi:MAG: DUF285 domain-containing protein [Candidatus Pacebacteria bacterium]|nr:DUF285 domain-containing protein [Candidatus Paceibacterota bacterium]
MTIITTIIGGGRTYRNFLVTLLFIFTLFISTTATTQASFTANDFITTWDTENTGTSASNQITIPGTGSGYSYSIYWESLSSSTATGTIATSTSASQTITFPEPGEYKVAIKGTYPRIYFNNSGDKLKILTVEQWGSNAWTSMSSAFYGCANLTVPATDAPNLSNGPAMFKMFLNASLFNGLVNHWDVSKVTDMQEVFSGTSFNQPINNWNTASATKMSYMFNNTPFNQLLDNWDVSNVTNMSNIFNSATYFNQDISMWNVSKVSNMSAMFRFSSFNQDISSWNISSSTNIANLFNHTPFNYDISMWDVSNVIYMNGVFNGNENFNQDLSIWDVSNVTAMNDMFLNAGLSQSNQDSTLQSWAAQPLQSNVPFHLGLKTYTSTGATALDTLRDTYNWTITEQYKAIYQDSDGYTLSGTITQSPITSGSSTTAVEVIPNNRCTFINWSDDSTTNPRTDILTDNLTVSANVECHNPTTSTSAKGRANKLEALGNITEANTIRQEYQLTPNSNLHTAITTLTTLATNPTITNDPQRKQQLITLLTQLVQILKGMRGG